MPKRRRARKEEKAPVRRFDLLRDAAVVAAVFLAPLVWTAPPILGAKARQGQALVTALLWAAWLAHLWDGLLTERRLRLPRLWLLLPAGAVVCAAAVSSFTSVNKDASMLFTLQLLAGAMLFALAAQRENRRMRAWAAAALVLAGVVGAIGGLRSYVIEWMAGGSVWRIFGPFFNPNLLAGFLVMIIPVAAVLALDSRGIPRVCYGFACAVLIAALLLTGSRGGWVAFLAAALVLGVAAGVVVKRARAGAAAAGIAVIAVAGLAFALPPLRARLLSSFSAQEHSNRFRILTWEATVRIAERYPILGSGPGTFEYVFPKYAIAGFTRMAHENYLQIAAENGLLGLGCFLWLMLAMVGATAKAVRRAESRADGMLAAGCLAGLAAFLVHGALDYTWFVGGIAGTAWLVGGLGAGAHGESLALRAPSRAQRRVFAFSAAALLLTWAVSYSIRAGSAEALALEGQQDLRAGDVYSAVESFDRAAAWEPANGSYWRLLGWALGPENGLDKMRQAIALEPTSPLPHAWLARMLRRAGDLEGAKEQFRKAIALNPNYTAAYKDIADIAMSQKKFGEARQAYLAMVRIEKSPYGEVNALEQVVETDYAFAHYGLGLLADGDRAAARAQFEQALQIVNDFEARGKGMSQLLEELGQADPARIAEVELLRGKVLLRLAAIARETGDSKAESQFAARAEQADGAARDAVAEEDELLGRRNAGS